jgi:lambda family phage tail tape measure protein
MGEQAFTSVTGNMTKAIDTFVQTGKINFKDLAGSIIKDLVSIQLKMSAMDLFKSVAGTGGGVMGGLGGLLSSVMGGGAASAATDTSVAGWAASAGITAHANGGTISSDAPVLVGERGPELFVPGRSGAVIPTNDMSAIGSSSGTVYNGPYIANMSAIDTQSAAQFLSNNKMTIFAANQSASRSLPMSR